MFLPLVTAIGGIVLFLTTGAFLYVILSIAKPRMVLDNQQNFQRRNAIFYAAAVSLFFTALVMTASVVVDRCTKR